MIVTWESMVVRIPLPAFFIHLLRRERLKRKKTSCLNGYDQLTCTPPVPQLVLSTRLVAWPLLWMYLLDTCPLCLQNSGLISASDYVRVTSTEW